MNSSKYPVISNTSGGVYGLSAASRGIILTRRMPCYAPRFHGKFNFRIFFREIFSQFFLYLAIPHPIWSLPAKMVWP
jgi:hypothetical protein